jgi:hypothetical protein
LVLSNLELGTHRTPASRSSTITVTPTRSGAATRFASVKGFVPVSAAHISVTAATGDIVRPAALPTDTIAPTDTGSILSASAGPWKKP